MNTFNLDEATYEPCLTYELILHMPVFNIFSLSYTLVDLQAIISGFTKVCLDDRDLDERLKDFKVKRKILDNMQSYAIEDLVKSRLKSVDSDEKEKLVEDIIQIIESPDYGLAAQYKSKIRPYPTTSRNFSKRYEHLLQIKEFKQGSFIATVASSVLAGIILKFTEMIFWGDIKEPSIINNNYFTININTDSMISIEGRPSSTSNELPLINASEYINRIITKVDLNPSNVESSVKSLLSVLQKEGIIYQSTNYNEKGIKTITTDLERFRGNFFDRQY